ncbi:hypothetical protein BDR03DRAFT_968237 [Suillus americanus]|nr:hypothetical protein BDR03DRAFT_968237 [Suillus americanus]
MARCSVAIFSHISANTRGDRWILNSLATWYLAFATRGFAFMNIGTTVVIIICFTSDHTSYEIFLHSIQGFPLLKRQ